MSEDRIKLYRRRILRIETHTIHCWAVFWAVFTFYCPILSSTTIIAFISADRIVIAADAKSLISKPGGLISVNICKIYQSGDSYFAFSGLDQWDDINFVSSDIAKKNMMLTVEGRADAFAEQVKGPLLTTLQAFYRVRNKEDNFPIYELVVGRQKYPLSALFVGMEHDSSVFEFVNLVKVVDGDGLPVRIETEISNCPGNNCPKKGHYATLWLGETDAAQKEFAHMTAMHDKRLKDQAAALRHLVETEIVAIPSHVGPPIAILEINKSGSRWVINGVCGKPASKPKAETKPKKQATH